MALRVDDSSAPMKQFVLGSYFMTFGFYTLPLTRLAQQGAAVISAYKAAGSPFETKSSLGIRHIAFSSVITSIAEIHTGKITGGPGYKTRAVELQRATANDQTPCYLKAVIWEATWEPLYSARIQSLDGKLAELLPTSKWAKSVSKPYLTRLETWPHLRRALSAIHGQQHQPHSGPCLHDTPSAESVQTWKKLMRQALTVARVPHSCQCDPLAVLKMSICAGMAVFFPECAGLGLPPSPARHIAGLSDAAVKLLVAAANCLEACLRQHESYSLFIFGKVHFMPAMSVYGRAVLHWFQWVLYEGGHRDQMPESIFPLGEHPFSEGSPQEPLPSGPLSICAALLLAQERGAADELAAACLPSTLLLARVLLGQLHETVGVSALTGTMLL
eukprot:scaffold266907_cov42-Prasinocladus_malaysianus.AAC.1